VFHRNGKGEKQVEENKNQRKEKQEKISATMRR
jgi:hypothetical protein